MQAFITLHLAFVSTGGASETRKQPENAAYKALVKRAGERLLQSTLNHLRNVCNGVLQQYLPAAMFALINLRICS